MVAFSKTTAVIPTRAMDGARVIWRHWQRGGETAQEGFIREFSADERMVRISKTDKPSDAGEWHQARDLRVVAQLDAAKAPKSPKRPSRGTGDDEEDDE